ncbi:MAG: polysaccharide pyruvyl transferase family protein [Thermoleophilaceae bacterium]|nr:polysaccharide pyruvyl transferase family protein [Thermoleophilaceae bacterium]
MKSLVAGWFSFDEVVATVGDLLARDVLCGWLDRARIAYEVANAPLVGGGVDWRAADPADYDRVIFVCGPFGRRPLLEELVERFGDRPLVGVDLTMLAGEGTWNPFDLLFERDGGANERARPDLSFIAEPAPALTVTAVLLAHPQGEYPDGLHGAAAEAIARLPDLRPTALFHTDTDLLDADRVRSAAEVAALIARADVVVTTRLHGLVLALRQGVPAVAIDPIAGTAKVSRQAEALGWPAVLSAASLTDEALGEAFDFCLTPAARSRARECADGARRDLAELEETFVAALGELRTG